MTRLFPTTAQQPPVPLDPEMEQEAAASASQDPRVVEKRWEKRMEREGEMDIGSELGSRESILSGPSKPQEKRKTEVGASAPQRSRDPRRLKEQTITDRPPIIDGQALNLFIYIPEKYHHLQFRDYKEVIEGVKTKKFKWTYDADYDENQLEELLLQGFIRIPRENIVKIPNDVFSKRRSGKTRSPITGTKVKQQQGKSSHSQV